MYLANTLNTHRLMACMGIQNQLLSSLSNLYNTFRYYDPDTGRFTQQDPIGLAGGINLYQYAPNPLLWIDRWGVNVQKLLIRKTILLVDGSILYRGKLLVK
ncbi:RHS repeat-associated core domain-containing protein [Thorsellia kenyensis]|uniref:RHS repeat-associated core domain-containing protein n=1 Tax=Thorsellia kenyensis TaxID=1549888 RepID=A0ABV6C888_9GAMM